MEDLLKRSAAGLVYVCLLLGAIFLGPFFFKGLCLFFGVVCISEFARMFKLSGGYFYLVFLLFWMGAASFPGIWMALAGIFTNIFLIFNFLHLKETPNRSQLNIYAIGYLCAGLAVLSALPQLKSGYNTNLITGIFFLIWINDTMAYLTGRFIGKTKLAPGISPKKTVEGFLGGFVGACLFALFWSYMASGAAFVWKSALVWAGIALITVLFGTLGDLVESKFKRLAQVKDSGHIMPGHGGLWDRLDSIIFATPFLHLFIYLIEETSAFSF